MRVAKDEENGLDTAKKRPLYHQLIALLCIPPTGACLVFFLLYHTLFAISPSLSLASVFPPLLCVIPPSQPVLLQ